MNLFQLGDFTLHSGEQSNFKIDCDALGDDDWDCIATLLWERIPRFRRVEGIPNGGLRLASFLERYSSCNPKDPMLIVDDVYTTGKSFKEVKGRYLNVIGAVVFARNPTWQWVTPLFRMY